MPGVLYDANNVVVGQATCYYAPWVLGTVKPLVADTTALFAPATWEAAGWVVAGATNEGWKITPEVSETDIMIEEQSTPAGSTVESRTITIEAELAESTAETIKLAWGGGTITTTAAGAGVPGSKKFFLTDTVQYWTIAIETRNQFGRARRFYIPKMTLNGSGETSFRRAADKQMFPIRMNTICPPGEIQVVDIVAAPTS